MATSNSDRVRFRYGKCLNDECEKGKSKEVIQIPARKDFVCPDCGKPLRECPPPKKSNFKPVGWVIALAVVVCAGLITWFVWPSAEPQITADPVPEGETVVKEPTDTAANTPIDTVAPPVAEPAPEPEKPKIADTSAPTTPKAAITVPFGTYSGPANGLDGEIKVTRNYTLDLRNAAHETIELQPGDVITRTKFKNGELVAGYWSRGSQSRSFHR